MTKAHYTKQVYAWERDLIGFQRLSALPIGKLRAWAKNIWKKERPLKSMPKIVAGKGIRYLNEYMSFSENNLIVLSRHQRNRLVLLHEICHYLGTNHELDHGPVFQDRYATMFFKYLV